MSDLETRRARARPPISERASARRVAARRSRVEAAAESSPVELLDVTTELPAYLDPEPATLARATAEAAAADDSAELAPEAAKIVGSSQIRRQASLARLDARSATRPFPDTAIDLDFLEPVAIAPKQPLLVRLLRLQHVRPTGWQRAAVGDLPILISVLLVLSDLATAWTLIALPAVVLALVKFHDIIESRLAPLPTVPQPGHPFGDPDARVRHGNRQPETGDQAAEPPLARAGTSGS